MRVAATQLKAVIADVSANLEACEKLVDQAVLEGAECVSLPEFFTTGMGFFPEIADCALPPNGEATKLLLDLAKRHGIKVGGSFLCIDDDGEIRNAYFLATPSGIAGRHNKDIPTMWENCFYVGGNDDGIIELEDAKIGISLCYEYNRYQTIRRLRGDVDMVMGGSFTWGPPKGLIGAKRAKRNGDKLVQWASKFAMLMGCPVIEACHVGNIKCNNPIMPGAYVTELGGGAKICDAKGRVLSTRPKSEGSGIVVADIQPGHLPVDDPIPNKFWITHPDALATFGWYAMGWHGRRWYRKNMRPKYQTSGYVGASENA